MKCMRNDKMCKQALKHNNDITLLVDMIDIFYLYYQQAKKFLVSCDKQNKANESL